MTHYTTSADGTKLAYSRQGTGAPLILIDGAFCHRNFGANVKLPPYLTEHFEVFTFDRRGKGESDNTLPYGIEREFEDLEAIIQETGNTPYVYGISSGAALALEAAKAGLQFKKIAVFEAPYIVDNSRPPLPEDYLNTIQRLVRDMQYSETIKYFMHTGIGLPKFIVWTMQLMPAWNKMKGMAPTLEYDTRLLKNYGSGNPLISADWQNIQIPVLVLSGTKSEKWAQNSMKQLANVLSWGIHMDLKGQNHLINAKVLAPYLINFFSEEK